MGVVRSADVLNLCQHLSDADTRFLIVGGLAVVAHGYIRATVDVDIVLDFNQAKCELALGVLSELGFRPRVPVAMQEFADPNKRREWQESKDMLVFTVVKGNGAYQLEIDLFLNHPFDFDAAYEQALWQEVPSGTRLPFVDLQRLLDMKQSAGRQKDLLDIAELRKIHGYGPG